MTPLSGGDAYSDKSQGIAFIRSGDFGADGHIDFSEVIWLKPDVHQRLMRNSHLKKGDVLFAIVGATIGKVAHYQYDREANINQAVCAVRLKVDIESEYIAAFFQTQIGQQLLDRTKRPVARANINLEEIGQLVFPKVSPVIQQQVIQLLRNGYKNRQTKIDEATRLLSSIDNCLLAHLSIFLPPEPENTIGNRIFIAQHRDLAGWRFDPQALHPEREACIHELQRRSSQPLYKVARFCRDLRTTIDEGAIYIGLENVESNTGRYIRSSEKESVSSAFAFRKGQILFPKLRPYLNKVFLAPFDGLCSTEFHVLEGITVSNEFLALFLRSQLVVKQTKHLMSGNTLPRLQTEDIESLLIPQVDYVLQKQIVDEAHQRMAEAEKLLIDAEKELDASKRQIEAILLGEVSA
jgi:hypothetical protein